MGIKWVPDYYGSMEEWKQVFDESSSELWVYGFEFKINWLHLEVHDCSHKFRSVDICFAESREKNVVQIVSDKAVNTARANFEQQRVLKYFGHHMQPNI